MDESRIVTPLGARSIALAVAVAAHALVAGLWLHSSPQKRSAEAASRSRAAMTVRVYSVPAQAAAPSVRVEAPVALAKPLRTATPRTRVAAAPTPRPPPQQTVVEEPPPAAPPSPTPPDNPPPAAVPGAAFAGLFAPIISRPLGTSGWGRRNTAPPPELDPQAQRERALLALRTSLLGRLNDLAGRLSSSAPDLRCDIAIDDSRHMAEVQCSDPADQGVPWSALQGLLVAGPVPTEVASLCLRLTGSQVSYAPCADARLPPSSEHRGTGFAGPLVLPPLD